jgi:patatin-like phospholipase/acyl hydrolase
MIPMNIFSNFFSKQVKPKKIISFDGGGVRAIAGIVFLKKLEAARGKKVSDMFDMFVGTSAGAFNAACFAHSDMSANQLKKYWSKEYTDRIMETSFFWDQASLIQARPRYESKGRVKVLEEIFGNKILGDSLKPLLTLCYDVEKRKHIVHTSIHTPEVSFIDAISASSAAPMYFPTYQMANGSWMIDGGVVTNNPTLLGLTHAKDYFKTNDIKVLSIGTGLNKQIIKGELSSRWGGVGWLRNDIMGMMLDSEIHNDIASDIIDKNYLRINSSIGKINRMLDDNSEENIEKIHLMGLEWWSAYGEETLKFIED